MRNCTKHIIRQLVKQAMNQTLTQEEQTVLDQHLSKCPDCRQMADRMRAESGTRTDGYPPRLTVREKEEIKKRVLERIQNLEPRPQA